MSIESDAASQVVGVYTQSIALGAQVAVKVGESTIKLTGKALKELIEFIAKSLKQEGKNGRMFLENFLKSAAKDGKTISMVRINGEEEFNKLSAELKSHGIPFAKARGKGCYDILFYEEDAPRMNMILDKLDLNTVEKVTNAKVEQTDIKENPSADVINYEHDLPFDDDKVTYHENADSLLNDLFDKEKERGDKENKVPTKDRDGNSSQPEKKSEKEKHSSISYRKSAKEVISYKKAERAEKAVESPTKPVDITKDIQQGVKSK